MKKIISLVAVVALLFCLALPASAATFKVNVTSEKKIMKKGDTQKITVSISDIETAENEDFNSLGFEIKLSDGLEITDHTFGTAVKQVSIEDAPEGGDPTANEGFNEFLTNGGKLADFGTVTAEDETTHNVGVLWSNSIQNGETVIVLTVKAKEDIVEEKSEQTVTAEVYSQTDKENPTSGDCTVKVQNIMIGDLNNDGVVNAKDRALLNRYVAKWEGYTTLENPDAADINGDGSINAKDRVLLNRYVAKWDGYAQYFE